MAAVAAGLHESEQQPPDTASDDWPSIVEAAVSADLSAVGVGLG